MRIRAATRASALAQWQADHVAELLAVVDPSIQLEKVIVSTSGDRRQDVPIHEIGGKGVFVKEVQAAVLDGRADIAVHSGKDLPAVTPEGLVLAAVPERGDPRDVLVGCRFDDLGEGALVGTGSIRRKAQLAWLRPDLNFGELRGNIATRLAKVGDFAAIVMAAAALDRLGESPTVVDILSPDQMLPQVAQGALAIECRADDASTLAALRAAQHEPSRRVFDAERGFLAELGGDCDLPIGAYAELDGEIVHLTGLLTSPDGRIRLVAAREGSDPEMLGRLVARHLLDDAGGARLLGR
jgi:hydroxymethylbilane synthase